MKIIIDKVPEGIHLTITPDAKSKPQTVVLSEADVERVVALLNMALKSERFSFSWER